MSEMSYTRRPLFIYYYVYAYICVYMYKGICVYVYIDFFSSFCLLIVACECILAFLLEVCRYN